MNSRTRLFWIGLFLEASGWQLLLPVFTPPSRLGLVLMAIGAVLLGFSLRANQPPLSTRALWCYFVAAAVVAIAAPPPARDGGVLMLCGVVLAWLARRRGRPGEFGYGILLTGLICVLQGALSPLLLCVVSRFHNFPVLAPVVGGLFQFFGHAAAWDSSTVYVQGSSQVQEYVLSSEYFGVLLLVNAACGVLVWLYLTNLRRKLRAFILFTAATVVYGVARYFLLALLYLDLPRFALFWNPWILCLSYLPLFLWLSAVRLIQSEPAPLPYPLNCASSGTRVAGLGPRLLAGGVAGLGALFLAAAWGWEDPGRIKLGRLLLDEAHSNWEKVDRAYDTEWYGEESGYNYYCLARFLEHYYRVSYNRERLTSALLAKCDILVIKTPTAAFTPEEVAAIEEFVERGGGLLLIGDHTNVFGTSTYLNAIARRFGIRYNYDATYDLGTGGLTVYEKPPLLPHPIVQWLPPFLFGTSCTLEVSVRAQVPITGYALRVAGHDYAAPSFFSHKTDGPFVHFGLAPQLAARKFGQGRVAAFTDSTVFSNFWMFVPGKPELMLGCTEWLNRSNRFGLLTWWYLGFGLLAGTASWRALRRADEEGFCTLLAAGAIGLLAGGHSVAALNRLSYPPATPHTQYPIICFDQQYSHFELPSTKLLLTPALDFHTLYVWVQRLGYVPRVCERLAVAVHRDPGIVVLNPTGQPSAADFREVREYVEAGGILFVFDSPTNLFSSANVFLAQFGLQINSDVRGGQSLRNAAGEVVADHQSAPTISGGAGLLFRGEQQPVLSLGRQGRGAVIACGDAELFSALTLGTVNQVPTAQQRRLYQAIFDLFRLASPSFRPGYR